MKFDVLANNGFHYEYVMTICAASVYAARKEFKRLYEGHYYTEDFRVRRTA